MAQPIYEMILWNSCNNNCHFCWLKENKKRFPKKFVSPEKTIRPIKLAEEFVITLVDNTPGSSVLFMGGELFDRELPKRSVRAFMKLTRSCIDRLHSGSLNKVLFNTNLIYKDTGLLFAILDEYKRHGLEDRVQITTSYDLEYRYKTPADLWLATLNMKHISERYPSTIRVANMIMTSICNNVLRIEPLLLNNFFIDTGFSPNLIPYIVLDKNIALKRAEQMELIYSLKEFYPDIIDKMVAGLDNSQPKKLLEYDGEHFQFLTSQNSPCGHSKNFRKVYKDSDECFVCDLIKLKNFN